MKNQNPPDKGALACAGSLTTFAPPKEDLKVRRTFKASSIVIYYSIVKVTKILTLCRKFLTHRCTNF